jgi:endogenous inhibitor of DNA gyrase (YacG/DUF329 family)
LEVKCNFCEKTVHKPPSLVNGREHTFCSKECSNNFKKGKSNTKLKKRAIVKCYLPNCDKEFELQPYRLKQAKRHFCSRICQFEWQKTDEYKKIHSSITKMGNIKCSFCNKTIERKPSEVREHYHFCNKDCRNNFMSQNQINPNVIKPRINVNCLECGFSLAIVESVYKKNKHGSFCTKDCYWSWKSKNLSGENNPLYERLKSNCSNCNKVRWVIPYDTSKGKHLFCSKDCYWDYRSKFYRGENSPRFGAIWTVEQRDKQRQILLNMYSNGAFDHTTSIQKQINHLLEQLKVDFDNEYLFKYYSVDNYLINHDLVIEVMGDYWHSNPIKYTNVDKLNQTQLDMVSRDKSKNTFLRKYHNINILYIWESDINSNPTLCQALVKLYIRNKGVLNNYHSFNYFLNPIGYIQLKESIISPHFE